MRKMTLFGYILLVCALMIVGCGKTEQSAAPRTEPVATPTQRLKRNDAAVVLTVAVDGANDALTAAQRRINDALSHDPLLGGVYIETVTYPAITLGTVDDIAQDIVSPTGPDIIVTDSGMAGYLYMLNAAYQLNEAVAKHPQLARHLQSVYPAAVDDSMFRGAMYAVPRSMNLLGMIYNDAYVADAGIDMDPQWTWDDMAEISRKLSGVVWDVASNSDDIALRTRVTRTQTLKGVTLCFTPECWLPFLWSNGGDYIDAAGELHINSPANHQTLTWLKKHISQGDIGYDIGIGNWFRAGGAAVTPGFLSAVASLNGSEPRYSATTFPRSPYTGESVTMMTTTVYMVNPNSPHRSTALDFLAAALGVEGQTITARELNSLPVRHDADLPQYPGLPPADVIRNAATHAKTEAFTGWQGTFPTQPDQFQHVYYEDGSVGAFLLEMEGAVEAAIQNQEPFWWRQLARPRTDFFGSEQTSGGPPTQEPPRDAWQKQGGVEIVFVASSPEFMPLVDEFNRLQDTIYVRLTSPSSAEFNDRVTRGLAANEFDVVYVPTAMVEPFVNSGALLALDRLLATASLDRSHDGGILDQVRINGELFYIPLSRVTNLVVAQQDAWNRSGYDFPRDGWTWAEYLNWARKVHDPTNGLYGAYHRSTNPLLIGVQRGHDVAEYPYPNIADDLSLLKELHLLFPDTAPRVQGPFLENVISGHAASSIAVTTAINASLRGTAKADDVILLPLPVPEQAANMNVGWVDQRVAIAAGTEHAQEAFTFVAWLVDQNEKVALHPNQPHGGAIPIMLRPEAYVPLERIYGTRVHSLITNPFRVIGAPNELQASMYETITAYISGDKSLDQVMPDMEEAVRQYRER